MRFRTFTIFLPALLVYALAGFAQQKQNLPDNADAILEERGEVYFSFEISDLKTMKLLTNKISIDRIEGTTVKAYANKNQFDVFRSLDYDYTLLNPPSMAFEPKMRNNVNLKDIQEWDFYPSYDAYLDLMNQFADEYPDLCEVYNFGYSEEGRELLMLKITDNVEQDEDEPEFLYTSSMHGDELAGYVLTLRLADYLLSNYALDPDVAALVNSAEIHLNPLANPDGTYAGGNGSVWGATRYNANSVDLNRNYPDPEDGPHPDGNDWQAETESFMQLTEDYDFVMSANFHGGAEVCNYPWDTWSQLHADDDWWYFVCREYADTAHQYAPTGYMDDLDNGVTNGYAWYSIAGGRQDYMNYFHQCREFTLELSNQKLLPENDLLDWWEYNHRSLINYMEQSLFGIRGMVTNANTGDPVKAKIEVVNHDEDSSHVYSSLPLGNYHRPIAEGSWDLQFSAPGYYPQTFNNITVSQYNTEILNVELEPGNLIADFSASNTMVSLGGSVDFTDESYGDPVEWAWEFEGSDPQSSTEQNPENVVYNSTGNFDVTLSISNAEGDTNSITKQDYISVNAEYLMSNSSVSTCTGIFYDSGGASGEYSNNEDFVMTFNPGTPGSKIKMNFIEFNVEYNSSCIYDYLEIYDGPSTSSPLIGTYCGTDSPGAIEATGEEGALTFKFHSDYLVTKPGWMAEVECIGGGNITQNISLDPFFQFVSAHVETDNPDMLVINESLLNGDLNFIRNTNGNMLSKIGPNWVNNIGDWEITEGYLYHMNQGAELQMEGTMVDPQTPISLTQGYQFAGYLPATSMNALDAFESIIGDNLDFVRNSGGNMLRKLGPNWVNGIGNTNPGEGYLIRMINTDELIYPASQKSIPIEYKSLNIKHFDTPRGNPAEAVFTIYVSNKTLKQGNELAVFNQDRLVGAAVVNGSTAYTEVPVFSEIGGKAAYQAGDQIQVKIWNNKTEEEHFAALNWDNPYGDAHIQDYFPAGDGAYSILKTVIPANEEQAQVHVYPNPALSFATVSYTIKEESKVHLSLCDITGRIIRNLKQSSANEGMFSHKIDCSNIPAGLYIIRLEISNAGNRISKTHKMIIKSNK